MLQCCADIIREYMKTFCEYKGLIHSIVLSWIYIYILIKQDFFSFKATEYAVSIGTAWLQG